MENIETPLCDIKMTFDQEYTLIRLAIPGSFAFVSHSNKKVWIGKGASILEGIGRNLMLLEGGTHGCGALQELYKQIPGFTVKVVGGAPGDAYINLWTGYKEKGFEVLSKSPSIWRIVEMPIRDPRPDKEGFVVAIYYINQSGRRTLAGVFETVAQARVWREDKLGDMKETIVPVYREDNLSRSVRTYIRDMDGE